MEQILIELGARASVRNSTFLVASFASLCGLFCAATVPGVRVSIAVAVGSQLLLWAVWFSWQGILFPYRRERWLAEHPNDAYRQAFFHDILPGVSLGLGLMARPTAHALAGGFGRAPLESLVIGVALLGAGAWLQASGFSAIGFAAAGFLFEYRRSAYPIVVRGVYRRLRHPLFLGGVLASLGAALLFNDAAGQCAALANLAILPIYRMSEDRRCRRIWGDSYADYCAAVPAFVPRFAAVQTPVVERPGVQSGPAAVLR